MIEGEDVAAVVTLGKNDDGCIRESDLEIAVFQDDFPRLCDVPVVEPRQLVGPARDLLEKEKLRIRTAELLDQVVDFRQNEWRDEERRLPVPKYVRAGVMMILIFEQRGENTARVEQDHSPKPSIRSPARSAIVGSPSFTPGNGRRGAGGR